MKNYEEMSNAVMEKVRICKSVRKRRTQVAVWCAVSTCCLLLSVVAVGRNMKKAEPSIQIYNPTSVLPTELTEPSAPSAPTEGAVVKPTIPGSAPSIKLLCATADSETLRTLNENVKVPYKAELRVRDITGMAEDEKKQVIDEENAYVQQVLGENPKENAYSRHTRDRVIVTMISAGDLSISFDDIEEVDWARVSVSEIGYIFYPRISGIKYTQWDENGQTVEVDGHSLRKGLAMLDTDNFVMHWSIAPSVADRFNENPNMEMASIRDQITITVAYTDGRVETKTVVMQACDDGQMTIMLLEGTLIDQRPA